MPAKSNSIGNLEIPALDLGTVNDRMRRIGDTLASLTGNSAPGGASVSSGATISQLVLTVPGILAVESKAAPLVTLPVAKAFTSLVLILGTVPVGGAVTVQLFANGAAWGPVVTATGQITTVDVSSYPAISKDALIRLDITSVPTTFPGADMTFELR